MLASLKSSHNDLKQMELSEFLHNKLAEIKVKNPRYSLRSMARKVKLPAGRLSELFAGKRKLSRYYAERLKLGLSLSPEEYTLLESWIKTRSRKTSAEHELREAEMMALSSWERFAILNLMKTVDFKPDVGWIAHRLGIQKETVELSLNVMLKVGLIEKTENGFARKYKTLSSSEGITSQAIQNSHQSTIQKSLQMMKHVPLHMREYTSITMAINPKNISRARKMIDRFQDKISEVLESGEITEVYNMNIQLFPLTQLREKI